MSCGRLTWWSVVAFISLLWPACVESQGCRNYDIPNGVCAGLITYPVSPLLSASFAEKALENNGIQLLRVSLAPYPQCYAAYVGWACSAAFPRCTASGNGTIVRPPCKSTCLEASIYCKEIFALLGIADQLPNCEGSIPGMMIPYPTQPDRCVALTVSGNQSEPANPLIRLDPVTGETTVVNPPTCRAPLVPNPNPALPPTAQRACFGACCISCPHLEAFFPPNKISSYLNVTDSLRAISAILSLFVLISYALLPGKRVHPTVILLWFVAAVFLFSATTFFNLGRRKATQCGDDNVSEADQGNNTTCAVQGAALFYASQASILWCAYLILNLHVTTVWNSHFFADKYPFIHTICWGVPLVVTAVGIYLKGVAFQFGSLCFLSSSRSSPLFFYPMSPFIFLGFAIHLWTVSYVARVAAEAGGIGSTSVGEGSSEGSARGESTRRRVMKIWRTSWRSMLLVTMFLTTFMYFWMFYFTQNDRVQKIGPGTPFITEWLKCILSSDGSQETCSNILTPHLPSYVVLVLADTFPSLMGIWLFIIFGLRGSIVAEWKEFFRRRKERNFVRDPTASGSEVVMGRWAVEEHVDRKGTREIRTNSRPQPSNSGFVKDSRSQHRYPPHSAPAYNSYMQSSSYDDAESAETTSSSVPMIRPTPEFVRPPPRPAGRRLE